MAETVFFAGLTGVFFAETGFFAGFAALFAVLPLAEAVFGSFFCVEVLFTAVFLAGAAFFAAAGFFTVLEPVFAAAAFRTGFAAGFAVVFFEAAGFFEAVFLVLTDLATSLCIFPPYVL